MSQANSVHDRIKARLEELQKRHPAICSAPEFAVLLDRTHDWVDLICEHCGDTGKIDCLDPPVEPKRTITIICPICKGKRHALLEETERRLR